MVHVLLLAILLVAFLGQKNKLAFPAAMFALGVFSAIRYNFGSDYQNYLRWYNDVHTPGAKLGPDEFLYNLLNILSPHYQVVIAVTSVAFILGITLLVMKNLPQAYHWMGLLVFLINPYLFLINLSAIRQCMAMILFVLAVHFAFKRNYLVYFLLLIAAIFFHKSALILFPIVFFLNAKPVRKRTVLAIFAAVLVLLLFVDLNGIVTAFALWFRDPNYLYYSTAASQNSLRATLLNSLFFIFVLTNLNKLEGKTLICGKLYLLGTIFSILAFRCSMFTRIQMYFDIFSVVALPAIFMQLQASGPVKLETDRPLVTLWNCFNKYAFPALLLAVFLMRYYSFFVNPLWSAFCNYQTFFGF